jgi:prophage antirepressor-like protein
MLYRMIGQPTSAFVTIVKRHRCSGPARNLPSIEVLFDDRGTAYLLGRDLMRMAGRPELENLSNALSNAFNDEKAKVDTEPLLPVGKFMEFLRLGESDLTALPAVRTLPEADRAALHTHVLRLIERFPAEEVELVDLEGQGPTSVITEVGIYRLILTNNPDLSAALSRWARQKLLPELLKLAHEGK